MASRQSTVDYIVEQVSGAGSVSARKMFGEYGIYVGGLMVASVCDDQLFVKPTPGGRALASDCEEAPPYDGAKPCLLIGPEHIEDSAWLVRLFQITSAELPPPRPKKRKP
jgi:TfoX/Sxy family transcriptional regulator of competence genes